MAKKTKYEYEVEVYRREDGKWESRVRLAHGKRNVIYNSANQGYNKWQDALRISKNLFATGYGIRFMLQRKGGAFKEVMPW